MSFLKRLLAGFSNRPAHAPTPPADRVAAIISAIEARAQPCLRLIGGGDGKSRLGGTPEMAGAWPRYGGRPLCCVAQLDLTEMRNAGGPDWLPDEGRLLFFYELEHGSWGSHPADAGSAVVLHETGLAVPAAEPDDLPDWARFDACPVRFAPGISYPDEERVGADLRNLSNAEEDALETALDRLAPPEPAHQIGGHPGAIQDSAMDVACQRVTHGLYGGNPGSHRTKRPDVADWRLLLQLDTDDDAGMMWGDCGRLYFWIPEQAAVARDFSRAWTILQCY